MKPECTDRDLLAAMQRAFEAMQDEGKGAEKGHDEEMTEERETAAKAQEVLEFVEALKDSGFAEHAALAAMKHVGTDIDEGIAWCLSYADDEEEGNSGEEEMDTDKRDEPVYTFTQSDTNLGRVTANLLETLSKGR